MKIDLNSIDETQFMKHPHVFGNEILYLVQPQHFGANWNQENKIFRSSVWNEKGELVSAGFPKFTNWGEKPENFPVPSNLKGATVIEKLDGSLLIVSKYKGKYILRTRGTVDASKLDNGHELKFFMKDVLPNIEHNEKEATWNCSYLFEWTSPTQKIVLNYGDSPSWSLVGIIHHDSYHLITQGELDAFAKYNFLNRPESYTFSSVDDLMEKVDLWKGKEGVCVYSDGDQTIHKVKCAWYLTLHHMKSELSSLEKVLDVWLFQSRPSYTDFYNYISTTFDFELAEQARGHISRICDAWKEVQQIEDGMQRFLNEQIRMLPTRRLQAVVVLQSYGKTNRSSFLFKLLDGKLLEKDDYKKLMFQVMKK